MIKAALSRFLPPLGMLLPIVALAMVATAGGFATGMRVGANGAEAACAQDKLDAIAAGQRRYDEGLAKGRADAKALQGELAAAAAFDTDLQRRLPHVPILAVSPRAVCPAVARPVVRVAPVAATAAAVDRPSGLDGAASPAGPAGAASAPLAEAAGPEVADPGSADDARLSAGAVSLWNSALAGTDVPAGACRAADPADPACAATTGLTVVDAWENHAINAAACRADRIRYQRLIDHVAQRQPARP
jgi:hypothetical protein